MLNEYLTSSHTGSIRAAAMLCLLAPPVVLSQEIVTSPNQSVERSAAFWTAARKAAAQPMPLRTASGTPRAAAASLLAGRSPGAVAGNLPVGAQTNTVVARAASATPASAAPAIGPGSTVWYNYPPPSTLSIPALDYFIAPIYPNSALGKLFFQGAQGTFVCSAQSVTSGGTWGPGNRQTVITAGHCCSTGDGTFFTNWVFEPAHLNGNAPFGSWVAHNAAVYNVWHQQGDLSRDVCVLQMRTLNGQSINDAVGALGYAFDLPLPQSYTATGWPANSPFTGGLLYYSFASSAETDTEQAGALPFTHGIGNVMTGGASGGAWITKYQSYLAGTYNYFNGLNSYKYTNPNRPAEMFGPYIDAGFINGLFQAVATAPPAP